MTSITKPEPGYTWLTYPEAATYCGISERAMRRAAQERKVEFTRLGLRTLFTREQLDAWVRRSTSDAVAP